MLGGTAPVPSIWGHEARNQDLKIEKNFSSPATHRGASAFSRMLSFLGGSAGWSGCWGQSAPRALQVTKWGLKG